MTGLSKYNIPFKGLSLGDHEFDYQIDKSFFDYFDGGIAEDGNVSVKVKLEKQSALMVLWFFIDGTVKVSCDRCLELYDQPIKGKNSVYVKYGETTYEEGDDVIWVSTNEHQINVGKLMYDFILLSLPIRHIHPEDKDGYSLCNPEMINKLENYSYNTEESEEKNDSRWDDLRKLLENE